MRALIVIALFALSACQTNRYKSFGNVKEGMQKDIVLDRAGGPDVSRRWHGKDRWIYNYQTPDGEQTREIHFEEGKATYVGNKVVPAVSAEDQDRMNEQSNAETQKRIDAEHAAWAEEHGVAYKLKSGDSLDNDDMRLQKSIYGTVNMRHERLKVAPTFEDVQ